MSYRGRPSKGCEGCRARKIKCDEAKPVCNRCSKSGHECKYRDQADLLFRDQTAAAAQRAEESWRKRSKSHQRAHSESSAKIAPRETSINPEKTQKLKLRGLRSDVSTSTDIKTLARGYTSFDKVVPVQGLESLAIAPNISPDLHPLAYQRFIYDFVTPENPNKTPEEPSDALFTFVPLLYQNAAPGSCLATIVDAICYINFSNRCKALQAVPLAQESFGKGIKLLSNLIADEEHAASNDALASVYLMGVYENLSSFQRRGTFVAHQHGANALLQLRTIEQYYSNPISARLYEVAYAQMLLANLQAAKPPPIPVENIVSVRKYLPNSYNDSNTFVIRLIWREAQLHARWQEMKQSENLPTRRCDLHQLLQTALDLDAEFQAWETTVPPAWKYKAQSNTAEARSNYDPMWQKLVLSSKGAPQEIHSYPNLKRCWIWGFYRTSRMFLLRDILEIMNWMFRLPEPKRSSCHARVDSAQIFASFDSGTAKTTISSLDNLALRMQHSVTTAHMVEKSCSAILGSFTVPVHGKSFEDVSGMRGYVVLWPMGTMDSILSAGLVPDIKDTKTSASANHPLTQTSSLARDVSPPVIAPKLSFDHDNFMATAANGTAYNPLMPILPQHQHSVSLPIPLPHMSLQPSIYNPSAKKGYIFDCHPRHHYDHSINLPTPSFNVTAPKSIDVTARREWLNRLLYYIGSELGIKKALAVPFMEGCLQIVKTAG